MKVIGSRSQEQNNVMFPIPDPVILQCKSLMGNKSDSVEVRATKFECSMGFSAMVVSGMDHLYDQVWFISLADVRGVCR